MKLLYPISIFLLLSFAFSSCSDDTVVGSGLFDDEELSLEHISDTPISARTIAEDSILTYLSNSTARQTYFLGALEDPYFGKSESQIYLNCGRAGNALPDFDDVTNDDLDSIVLALKLDPLGFYGDPDATFNIKVYRIRDMEFQDRDTIYSDEDFVFDPVLIGEVNDFKPAASSTDTLRIQEEGQVTELAGIGQIRIPLDIELAEEILLNKEDIESDTSFMTLLNGFYIVAESSSSSMIAVDLSPAIYQSRLSELAIFYNDTSKYSLGAGLVKTSRFTHDYTGSSTEEGINGDFTFGDSLLFVESMSGTNVEFEFPSSLSQYNDRVLNFAELELTVAEFSDYSLEDHPVIDLLLPSSNNEEGVLNVLEDFTVFSTVFIPEVFTETESGQTLYKYRIPLTRYIREIIKGTSIDNTLTLSAFLKSERPNKSVIYGTRHSTYPSKLRLTFTK